MVTRGDWAKRFLRTRSIPVTVHRKVALVSWETAEGTPARFNPLATTWNLPGQSDSFFNSVGVRNYASLGDGCEATWLTLEKGEARFGYGAIVSAIKRNAPAQEILEAVAHSAWGTGWLALQVLPFARQNLSAYASKPIGQ